MCEQCLVNPLYFGEVLPGWFLMRARRDGSDWKMGEWGLVQVNDPTYIWKSTPQSDPTRGMNDEELDAYCAANPNSKDVWPEDDFFDGLEGDPLSGHQLVKAAMDKGYDPEKDGYNFLMWLWGYLGDWIRDHEPETDEDPFPFRDTIEGIRHDYTLGKT